MQFRRLPLTRGHAEAGPPSVSLAQGPQGCPGGYVGVGVGGWVGGYARAHVHMHVKKVVPCTWILV